MNIQDYTDIMTYLSFNFAFFRNVNTQTIDMAFPLVIKSSYPLDAKQPYFVDDMDFQVFDQ
ncbi:MAG: hypothetical protein AB8U25_01220 [Rickettsiales endosymbiont of Dermacentor nuttalli]